MRLPTQSLNCNIKLGFHLRMKEFSSKTLVSNTRTPQSKKFLVIMKPKGSSLQRRHGIWNKVKDLSAGRRALERELYKMFTAAKTQIALQSHEEKDCSSLCTQKPIIWSNPEPIKSSSHHTSCFPKLCTFRINSGNNYQLDTKTLRSWV